jgi:serine/threonine protein kinase
MEDNTKEEDYKDASNITKTKINEEMNKFDIYGSIFNVPNRYEVNKPLGSGAYGWVVQASDQKKGEEVAIKKMERTFEHALFAKRTLRELKILRLLHHENIIELKTIVKPEARDTYDEIYAVFELMETDLGSIIKSKQELSIDHIQFFLYQMIRGMKYCHSAGILHRDLKPRNLLVNANCDLKIWDFGLSRANLPTLYETGSMTDYIATRWYRAPELLFGSESYTAAVDVWSIGCIFAELLTRESFLTGTDTENQLELIIEMLGMPSDRALERFWGGDIPEFIKWWKVKPYEETEEFKTRFKDVDETALDLMKKMLMFDPSERISIDDAIKHDFFHDLHCEEDEPVTEPVDVFDFDFEKYEMTIEETKNEIYEEIALYHSSKAQKKYIK